MAVILEGEAYTVSENVNTDLIIPGRHCHITDPEQLARHTFEDLDPAFREVFLPGGFVVAGANFGCGSSREEAATVLKASGVAAVIAESFARIFFRNAINAGLPILECPPAVDAISRGDLLRVDLQAGTVECLDTGRIHHALPLPRFLQDIVTAGGLVAYVKRQQPGSDRLCPS